MKPIEAIEAEADIADHIRVHCNLSVPREHREAILDRIRTAIDKAIESKRLSDADSAYQDVVDASPSAQPQHRGDEWAHREHDKPAYDAAIREQQEWTVQPWRTAGGKPQNSFDIFQGEQLIVADQCYEDAIVIRDAHNAALAEYKEKAWKYDQLCE